MPEDLLMELEPAAPIAGSLADIEKLAHEALRHDAEVGLAVQGMRGSASTFDNLWRRIVLAVAKGDTAELQAARPRLLAAFEKRLRQLKDTHAVATWLVRLGSKQITDPDVLLGEIAAMERLRNDVFNHWQTAEDLEDLAARDYPLTTADLDRIGPQHRPPAAFYAEESKPF
jgi:hypothetical protein